MTPTDLGKIYGFTRQSICRNIQNGRIKAKKINCRWVVEEENFKEYMSKRYTRNAWVFRSESENYTPKQCAQILDCSPQRIYYHLRTGHIKSTKYKCAWVINLKDLMEYKKLLVQKKTTTRSYTRKYKPLRYIKN